MLLILAGPEVAKGRHLHHLRFPPLRGEYVISNLASSSFFSYSRGLPKANPTYILIYLPSLCSFLYFFITSWQSKRKEDTSSTHPILLDKMELEVYPVLLHAFPMSHVTVCSFFVPFFLYIYHHSSFLPLFFFFFFFRPTLSPFLFITLRVRRSPLPWAHPWRVSLSRQILWLRPLPLLLLLHRELLPRLCFLYIGLVLLSRVPRLRGLVSSLLSLLRLLHLKKE